MRITIDVTDWRDRPAKTKADLAMRAYIVACLEDKITDLVESFAEDNNMVIKVYNDPTYD